MPVALRLIKFIALAAIAGSAALSPRTVHGADELLPEKTVGVRERPHPGYEATGVKIGTFSLRPRLSIGETFDDNIYATNANEIDDLITELSASARLQSSGVRIPAAVFAGIEARRYGDHSREDYIDWNAGGSLGYEIGARTRLDLQAESRQTHQAREDLTFPMAVIEPPAILNNGGMLKLAHEFARGTMTLSGDYQAIDFEDAQLSSSAVVDQDFRDRDVLTTELRSTLGIWHSIAALVRVVHTEQQYRYISAGLDRDSRSDALFGGATFEITNLMRGELGVGAIRVNNLDPSQSDNTSLAFSGNIEFFVTQLMTLTLDLQRTSEAADLPGSASYIGTKVSLNLDYELRRNFLITAKVLSSQRDYSNIERSEDQWSAAVGGRWLLNRRASVNLGYTYQERSKQFLDIGENFHRSVADLTVNFAL